jgi:Tc toxin complex TcA C-terminal TcB-binding domain/Neuraminidase-like domain/PA14 domain/Salmonella virulence plasmid 28.1kDa A protein/Putative peptidoglycan binding domain
MNKISSSIPPNSTGAKVADLQDALGALGFRIVASEIRAQAFGISTTDAIKVFQGHAGLPVTGLVDAATAASLNAAVGSTGVQAAGSAAAADGAARLPLKYTVSGRVLNVYGEPLEGEEVQVTEVNLRGVAIYKTATTLEELTASNGFVFLGNAKTDVNGNFQVPFETALTDVVAFALDGNNNILGYSALIITKGGMDLTGLTISTAVSAVRGVGEYTRLTQVLLPFVKKSDLSLYQLSASADQVGFLATETNQDAAATSLAVQADQLAIDYPDYKFQQELFYGLGRQNIALSWPSLFLETQAELSNAIQASIAQNIIQPYSSDSVSTFLQQVSAAAADYALTTAPETADLSKVLGFALSDATLQKTFVQLYTNFTGTPQDFWSTYLPQQAGFTPAVISSLQLTNQLSILTGQNVPLMEELLVANPIKQPSDLLAYSQDQWTTLIAKTGVPAGVPGATAAEQATTYITAIQNLLNGAYPTQKIASMVSANQFPLNELQGDMVSFFSNNPNFDISTANIAGLAIGTYVQNVNGVKTQLSLMQRVFQVSPTPDAMTTLIGKGFASAMDIVNVPQQSFVDVHAADFGGADIALSIHNRAVHQYLRSQQMLMKSRGVTSSALPASLVGSSQKAGIQQKMAAALTPNNTDVFDISSYCACSSCLSVYSPASYLVDIMQYLDSLPSGVSGSSVLGVMLLRRPDIANLLLTCENTNTEIPFIDLVNEVMEYYVANINTATPYTAIAGNLPARDTGDASTAELTIQPQYTIIAAYQNIYAQVYPFTLPYHQPLDVIRTYLAFLKTSRAALMGIFPYYLDPVSAALTIIPPYAKDAETMKLSLNEYVIQVGQDFFGNSVAAPAVETYYGSPAPVYTGSPIPVPDFLTRTGLAYKELVAVLKTQFINGGQGFLTTLQTLFPDIVPATLYSELANANTSSAISADIAAVLLAQTPAIPPASFITWVQNNWSAFNAVVTLYDGTDECNITSTFLDSIQYVYTSNGVGGDTGISTGFLSNMHRFIRLWRKTGWAIHELDAMIIAVGETTITPLLINKLATVSKINSTLGLPLLQLACLWGNIDTYGKHSLYAQLFLGNSGYEITPTGTLVTVDPFAPDPLGAIFSIGVPVLLTDPAVFTKILSAIKISAADFNAIIADSGLGGAAVVSLENLSILYRYALLADSLDIGISDLCTIKSLFGLNPFGFFASVNVVSTGSSTVTGAVTNGSPTMTLTVSASVITGVNFTKGDILLVNGGLYEVVTAPSGLGTATIAFTLGGNFEGATNAALPVADIGVSAGTLQFIEKVTAIGASGFDVPTLNYMLTGTFNTADGIAITTGTILQALPALRNTILEIGLDNPSSDTAIMTVGLLRTKLTLLYSMDVANTLISMLYGAIGLIVESAVPDNSFVFPGGLTSRISIVPQGSNYVMQCVGLLNAADHATLIGLTPAPAPAFLSAINDIYNQCQTILTNQAVLTATVPGPGFGLPAGLNATYSFVSENGVYSLQCVGLMSTADQTALMAAAPAAYQPAIGNIYAQPGVFVGNCFSSFLGNPLPAAVLTSLFNLSGGSPSTLPQILQYFYPFYLPYLVTTLQTTALSQSIGNLIGLNALTMDSLLAANLEALLTAVTATGLNGTYYTDTNFSVRVASEPVKPDPAIDYDWFTAPLPLAPQTNNFSVEWDGWICADTSDNYVFAVTVGSSGETVKVWIDGLLIIDNSANPAVAPLPGGIALTGGSMYSITVQYVDLAAQAGIHLSWSNSTTSQTIIDTSYLYPAAQVNTVIKAISAYQQAALFINGFTLTTAEVNYFLTHSGSFAGIDFQTLTPKQFLRIYHYTVLRTTIPSTPLLSLFQTAGQLPAGVIPDTYASAVVTATNWNAAYFSYLAGSGGNYFGLAAADFQNEKALLTIQKAINIATTTGMPIGTKGLPVWVEVETSAATSFGDLHQIALEIQNAVKALHQNSDWQTIGPQLNNVIRDDQRDALVSYLVNLNPKLQVNGVPATDANGLYEYFLIDVQMEPCMLTSRLIQATMAVQLWAMRCQLGLENLSVSISAIANTANSQWSWMQNYAVAAAWKQMCVDVENYLDPSLRDDKTPFFQQLEADLFKSDITAQTVEAAYRSYLVSLSEVSNLEVCGMYDDAANQTLHVFARNHAAPYTYYYRNLVTGQEWSAWEEVPLDIKSIDDRDNSGVHLVPVVWNNRLFLFWPEFAQKADPIPPNDTDTPTTLAKSSTAALTPPNYWEIRLASSEYDASTGKWIAKKLTKETLNTAGLPYWSTRSLVQNSNKTNFAAANFYFVSSISFTSGTIIYVNLSGTFKAGDTITDVNGSTAVVEVDNGENFMLITSIAFAAGFTAFSGKITGSLSLATATASINANNSQLELSLNYRYTPTTDNSYPLPYQVPIPVGSFTFDDPKSKVEAYVWTNADYDNADDAYGEALVESQTGINYWYNSQVFFQAFETPANTPQAKFIIGDTTFLDDPNANQIDQRILFSNGNPGDINIFNASIAYPFFFRDMGSKRVYFATPASIEIFIILRSPILSGFTPINIANSTIAAGVGVAVGVGRNTVKVGGEVAVKDAGAAAVKPAVAMKPAGGAVAAGPAVAVAVAGREAAVGVGAAVAVNAVNAVAINTTIAGTRPPVINLPITGHDYAYSLANINTVYRGGIYNDTGALGGNYSGWRPVFGPRYFPGLAFYTFYHPYVTQFINNLNQGGVPGLFLLSESIPGDGGLAFTKNYQPTRMVVPYNPNDAANNYYLENLDFSQNGTYSIYNWELFYHIPMLLGVRLSTNGQYAEAMQWFNYIFNPNNAGSLQQAFQFPPFQSLIPDPASADFTTWLEGEPTNDYNTNSSDPINQWRQDPFNAFLIARSRPVAFMLSTVMAYLDNLIAWGDSLYLIDTRESINLATQLYVMAAQILGPQPQYVPSRGTSAPASYATLKADGLDAFGDALVNLENLFPFTSSIQGQTSASSVPYNLLGIGQTLYFCVPPNAQLLAYWTTVGQRLFNIRHCRNINGVEQTLALFQPPLNPALIQQALAQGISLGSILADLDAPSPLYRYSYLSQKAKEYCGEVISLGNSLLSACEKTDAEQLARMRSTQEITLLNMQTTVKKQQVLDANAGLDSLMTSRTTSLLKLTHFVTELLGNTAAVVPDAPVLPDNLTDQSTLPPETIIAQLTPGPDVSLVSTDETGIKVINKENTELQNLESAYEYQQTASGLATLAGILHLIPELAADIKPFGVGAGVSFGGNELGSAATIVSQVAQIVAAGYTHSASQAGKMASYIRREQEWVFQANITAREIIQLDKQIVSAQIKQQIAENELANQLQEIQNAQAVDQFLYAKFTNEELYEWMKGRLQDVLQQTYNLAFGMAKKAELAYQQELGLEPFSTDFIQYGYYLSSYIGIGSGEPLQLALNQMENSFIEQNVRNQEIVLPISLAIFCPQALLQLSQTGSCSFGLDELFFDLLYPGQYLRMIKSVRISIPCVAGPFTNVSAKLTYQGGSMRMQSNLGSYSGNPAKDNLVDWANPVCSSMVASSGQNDAGMFELNFRDDRYLPYEGAGAVYSQWLLELPEAVRSFDYSTISDVVLHISYTAKDDGNFRDLVESSLAKAIQKPNTPFQRLFAMKSDFPDAFYQLVNVGVNTTITLNSYNFPYFFNDSGVKLPGAVNLIYVRQGKTYTALTATSAISAVAGSTTSWQFTILAASVTAATAAAGKPGVAVDDMLILLGYTSS